MKKNHPKVLAFDLDGTLTQHKTPLSQEYAYLLHLLSKNIVSSWSVPDPVLVFTNK